MKALSFVLLISLALCLPAHAQTDSTQKQPSIIFTVVEQHPEFPGGMRKLGQYIEKNLRYPEAARRARVEGRVFVNFVVTDQGRIEQVKVLKGFGFGTDEEAIRLVASMPNWIPARQTGKPVNVYYNLPINFRLQ
ncbi:energy transducer TonB [Spirosoma validum]|uniref:Energy transducer TonB n=1 Tax=Spirosoma validum TaxID=2771355 RepID=A0A927GDG1_9BACT|nr:energy transducer TonB [Spirosoma validum]MBD2753638.1 energy transducer TonB [Spirosoma validum]